ncbi:Hypothetical_protein [Hexamita inflata]|uniref:Hypothetical_protein n=1 Tax=Hexamita inflata TaxID=28002 RepID=A0AA86UWN4_9EUKA|nr:Hypothetical protein HINF_LOCUS58589 [Hexamita inflata]
MVGINESKKFKQFAVFVQCQHTLLKIISAIIYSIFGSSCNLLLTLELLREIENQKQNSSKKIYNLNVTSCQLVIIVEKVSGVAQQLIDLEFTSDQYFIFDS